MYRVQIGRGGVRDLERIREPDISRIKARVLALETAPRPHGARKLKDPLYRIRAGDWRILYTI